MDLGKIEGLIQVLEGSRTRELSVRRGETRVHIRKGDKTEVASAPPRRAEPKPETSASPETQAGRSVIRAPMVGIFHATDGAVRRSAMIARGQVVGAIESMKLLNDVVSDVAGTVAEVMVEDGTPVEYGQPLYAVEVS